MALIVMLLGLAGFFMFAQKPIEAPAVGEVVVPVTQQAPVVEPDYTEEEEEEKEEDAVGEDTGLGDTSTTTASTTLELEADLEE